MRRSLQPRTQSHRPKAAVFDFDGLLVDTAGCWAAAYGSIVRSVRGVLPEADFRGLNGASVRHAAELLSGTLDHAVTPAAVTSALAQAFERHEITPMPGAEALLSKLRELYPMAIATNAPETIVRNALLRIGLHDYFDAIVASEQVGADKPRPDVYLVACEALRTDPSDAVALEDSVTGVRSARTAGLMVAGVTSVPGEVLEADLQVESLDDRRLYRLLGL